MGCVMEVTESHSILVQVFYIFLMPFLLVKRVNASVVVTWTRVAQIHATDIFLDHWLLHLCLN